MRPVPVRQIRRGPEERPHRHGEGRAPGGRGPGHGHHPRPVPLRLHHLRGDGPGLRPEFRRPLLLPHVPARGAGSHPAEGGQGGGGGRHRHRAAAHVPHRNGHRRGGGLFLHLPGEAAGGQGQVRPLRLLLLDRGLRRPGRQLPLHP